MEMIIPAKKFIGFILFAILIIIILAFTSCQQHKQHYHKKPTPEQMQYDKEEFKRRLHTSTEQQDNRPQPRLNSRLKGRFCSN